jgi:hypothetical protein
MAVEQNHDDGAGLANVVPSKGAQTDRGWFTMKRGAGPRCSLHRACQVAAAKLVGQGDHGNLGIRRKDMVSVHGPGSDQ